MSKTKTQNKVERRFLPREGATFELRADDDQRQLVGYAAVFYDGTRATEYELWPGVVERIMSGAFKNALKRPDDVRGLVNHEPDNLIGRTAAKTLKLKTDKRGLQYEVDLPDTQVGRDLAVNVERGDMSGSSFAFRVEDEGVKWKKEKTEEGYTLEIREIRSVELFDVGPVTYPAYESTTTGLRAEGNLDDVQAEHAAWQADQRQKRIEMQRVQMLEMGIPPSGTGAT